MIFPKLPQVRIYVSFSGGYNSCTSGLSILSPEPESNAFDKKSKKMTFLICFTAKLQCHTCVFFGMICSLPFQVKNVFFPLGRKIPRLCTKIEKWCWRQVPTFEGWKNTLPKKLAFRTWKCIPAEKKIPALEFPPFWGMIPALEIMTF